MPCPVTGLRPLSTTAMAIAALMSVWYTAMQRRSRRFAVVGGRAYRARNIKLGRGRAAAWSFVALYLMLAKVLPIGLIVWSSLLPFFQLPSPARSGRFRRRTISRYLG